MNEQLFGEWKILLHLLMERVVILLKQLKIKESKFLTRQIKNNISDANSVLISTPAWVAELVDARDLKSLGP